MKFLIGAACVAIIAAVSYYFIQEFQASAERAEIAHNVAMEKRARAKCDGLLELVGERAWNDDEMLTLTNCLFTSRLTEEQVQARIDEVKAARK